MPKNIDLDKLMEEALDRDDEKIIAALAAPAPGPDSQSTETIE